MTTYESISLVIMSGMSVVTLISLIIILIKEITKDKK